METYETTTATGEGFWGKAYRIKLFRRTRLYTCRFGPQQRELADYGFSFQDPTTGKRDQRIFSSEAERSAFMARGITDLHLTALPIPPSDKTQSLFAGLIGDRLSSVTFVADYVQMHFDDHSFNFYNWPLIYEGQAAFTHEQDGYCQKLVSLIGKTIKAADEYLDVGLALEFEGGPLLSVPLRVGKDWPGRDIAEYAAADHLVVWSADEPPYE